LKVITIWLPPLSQRAEDIPLLSHYFLTRFARELGLDNPGLAKATLASLQNHSWPGNVRELANTLQKALIFNRGAPITIEDIALATGRETPMVASAPATGADAIAQWARKQMLSEEPENVGNVFEACMDRFASLLITEALNMTGGNRSSAAKLLGLSRPTLHSKIEKYGLKIQASVKPNSQ
jgi:DNA-binding NtrC family response regulator